jgi:hypothetical protein
MARGRPPRWRHIPGTLVNSRCTARTRRRVGLSKWRTEILALHTVIPARAQGLPRGGASPISGGNTPVTPCPKSQLGNAFLSRRLVLPHEQHGRPPPPNKRARGRTDSTRRQHPRVDKSANKDRGLFPADELFGFFSARRWSFSLRQSYCEPSLGRNVKGSGLIDKGAGSHV